MFPHSVGKTFGAVAIASLMACSGCEKTDFTSEAMREHAERLKETGAFQFPLKDYFPQIPLTDRTPPRGERYHAAEDSFAPAGTPVYAIGNGIIRYSGKARGYGGLMIIDHPGLEEGEENSLLIGNDGYRFWLGRQYYISRFDHDKPKAYLAHASIDDDLVCLGSWFGLKMRVLAVKK